MAPAHPLRGIFTKFRFTAVVNPVSVADKAESDDPVLGPDLDLTCDAGRFFYFPKIY